MLTAIATDIKDFSLSDDGREATFVLVTKHSGDIAITVPADCLQVLRPPAPAHFAVQSAMSKGGPSPFDRGTTPSSSGASKPAVTASAADRPAGNVTVTVPKKWYVAGDSQKKLVIVVFDPMTPNQYGFALQPRAATEFGDALAKKAADVIAGTPPKPKAN